MTKPPEGADPCLTQEEIDARYAANIAANEAVGFVLREVVEYPITPSVTKVAQLSDGTHMTYRMPAPLGEEWQLRMRSAMETRESLLRRYGADNVRSVPLPSGIIREVGFEPGPGIVGFMVRRKQIADKLSS